MLLPPFEKWPAEETNHFVTLRHAVHASGSPPAVLRAASRRDE
jgi:hypothetical protein